MSYPIRIDSARNGVSARRSLYLALLSKLEARPEGSQGPKRSQA